MANITITVTIDDTDQLILKNDISNINDWVQFAAKGKINNCWKRMQSLWTANLMNDASFTDPIPNNKAEFVTLVTSRADYKDRVTRDAEEEAKMEENNPIE